MSRTQADDLNYALRELDELTNPPAEWVEEGIRPVRGDVSVAASNLLRELIFRAELPLPQLAQVADGASGFGGLAPVNNSRSKLQPRVSPPLPSARSMGGKRWFSTAT